MLGHHQLASAFDGQHSTPPQQQHQQQQQRHQQQQSEAATAVLADLLLVQTQSRDDWGWDGLVCEDTTGLLQASLGWSSWAQSRVRTSTGSPQLGRLKIMCLDLPAAGEPLESNGAAARLIAQLAAWPRQQEAALRPVTEAEWLRGVDEAWSNVQGDTELQSFLGMLVRCQFAGAGGWRLRS